jgi:hypothetical protein
VRPYWFQHRAQAKGHWVGQPLIRMLTSHFHRHPPAYYVRVLLFSLCVWCACACVASHFLICKSGE